MFISKDDDRKRWQCLQDTGQRISAPVHARVREEVHDGTGAVTVLLRVMNNAEKKLFHAIRNTSTPIQISPRHGVFPFQNFNIEIRLVKYEILVNFWL